MTFGSFRGRLAAVPPFTLGFVQLCLLQVGVDRIDPTAGDVERVGGLFLLAFAVSGLVVAFLRDPAPARPGSVLSGLLLRGGTLLAAVLLLGQALGGARLNPLADLQFVVSLLLLALVTLPYGYVAGRPVDAFLVSLPLTASKLAALP